MLYHIALFGALTVLAAGLLYRIARWFRLEIDLSPLKLATPSRHRLRRTLNGILATLCSPKLAIIIKAFVKDVVLQRRILKEDYLRWLRHMLISYGFIFLFFTHALDKIIETSFFDPYYLKLNPFLLAAGLMVLAGIAISVYRRFIRKVAYLKTNSRDVYALAVLAVIVLSGMAMELTKLTSYNHYQKFWYIHILSCFLGLALIPFSKMIHILITPLSLLVNAVMDRSADPANIQTRQMMELDACMHCGTCSNRCSVAAAFDRIGNALILPAERMVFLKGYFARKDIGAKGLLAIQQGIYLCTNCDRCTVVCPARINLRDLWFYAREEIIQKKAATAMLLTPFSHYRGLQRQRLDQTHYNRPVARIEKEIARPYPSLHQTQNAIPLTPEPKFAATTGLSESAATYSYCFACENCSTVCPVVGHYDDPEQSIDLMPHQIMRAVGLGMRDLAMGSRMLWYCLTCYQCQEHCPQGVKVTDILFELKTRSAKEGCQV